MVMSPEFSLLDAFFRYMEISRCDIGSIRSTSGAYTCGLFIFYWQSCFWDPRDRMMQDMSEGESKLVVEESDATPN